jgi:hypothetical protein
MVSICTSATVSEEMAPVVVSVFGSRSADLIAVGRTRIILCVARFYNSIARTDSDESCAETRFRLSGKRTSPFESAGVSFQSPGRRLCVNIVSWGRLLAVANTLITVWKCHWKAGRTYVFIAGSSIRQVLTCISLSIAGLPTPFACFL